MNIEEKAKEYVNELYMQTTHLFKERCIAREGYLSGYTQAETDLNVENEKLREVLSSLVDKVNMLTYSIVEEDIDVNSDFFAETMDSLAKAKQLITE